MSFASATYAPASDQTSILRRCEWTPAGAALLAFSLTLFSRAVLGDGDTFWHIAAGQWILAHHAVPTVDHFTFSVNGRPWTAQEWLSEVFVALSFKLAGWRGVLLLTGAAFAATTYIVARRLARDLDGIALMVAVGFGMIPIFPSLLARPHLFSLPLLAAWAAGMFNARDRNEAPSLLLLPIMVLWVNMHGGFAFGLALIGPFALEALLAAPKPERWRTFNDWAIFGVLAVGAALINPHGVKDLIFPFYLLSMKSLSHVVEWQPTSFSGVSPLEIELLTLLGFAIMRPLRMPVLRLILLLGLIHMALHHARHVLLLGVIAPMLLARPMAAAIEQDPPETPSRLSWRQSGVIAALALVVIGLRFALPCQRTNSSMAPISALAAVPPELRAKPVLNDYDFGGYLIYSGVKTYIDGRTDLFGDAFMDNYFKIDAADPKALNTVLSKDHIAWAILPPGRPVAHALEMRPGWKEIYKDKYAVVLAREDELPLGLRQ